MIPRCDSETCHVFFGGGGRRLSFVSIVLTNLQVFHEVRKLGVDKNRTLVESDKIHFMNLSSLILLSEEESKGCT